MIATRRAGSRRTSAPWRGDLYHYSNNAGGVEYHFAGLECGAWETLDVVTPEMGYPFFHNRWHFAQMECSINVTSSPHGVRLPYLMAYNPEAAGGAGRGAVAGVVWTRPA